MLSEYDIIYSVRYYPQFHVTAVGLGMYYPRIRGLYCIHFSVQSTQPYITNLLGNIFWLVISQNMLPNRLVLCRLYTEKYILDIHWTVNIMGMNNLKINIKFIENPFSSSQVVIFV